MLKLKIPSQTPCLTHWPVTRFHIYNHASSENPLRPIETVVTRRNQRLCILTHYSAVQMLLLALPIVVVYSFLIRFTMYEGPLNFFICVELNRKKILPHTHTHTAIVLDWWQIIFLWNSLWPNFGQATDPTSLIASFATRLVVIVLLLAAALIKKA